MSVFFSRSIPAYFWLAVAYAIFVLVVKYTTPDINLPAPQNDGHAGPDLTEAVELALQNRVFSFPLPSGEYFPLTWLIVFVIFGFISAWIEVLRALEIRNTGGNDTYSVIVTGIALVLFITYPPFSTSGFAIVVLVGFGDVILDRQVGQAVARRDFGGLGDG